MRLDLADLLRTDGADPNDAVRGGLFENRREQRQLGLFDGNHELTADLVWNAIPVCEVERRATPFQAQSCLQRPGRVGIWGVDNPAIATRLVCRERRLLLKEYQFQARPAHEQFKGRCESDDPATNHDDIGVALHRGAFMRGAPSLKCAAMPTAVGSSPGRSGSGASGSWTTLASLASQSLNV